MKLIYSKSDYEIIQYSDIVNFNNYEILMSYSQISKEAFSLPADNRRKQLINSLLIKLKIINDNKCQYIITNNKDNDLSFSIKNIETQIVYMLNIFCFSKLQDLQAFSEYLQKNYLNFMVFYSMSTIILLYKVLF